MAKKDNDLVNDMIKKMHAQIIKDMVAFRASALFGILPNKKDK